MIPTVGRLASQPVKEQVHKKYLSCSGKAGGVAGSALSRASSQPAEQALWGLQELPHSTFNPVVLNVVSSSI